MPRSRYHVRRASSQYSYHLSASAGRQKYSISICSNSRVRKTNCPGVISLRKALPTWAIPNGSRIRAVRRTLSKLMKIPWAVSGRRYTRAASSSTGPAKVLNRRLNCRASPKVSRWPQLGQRPGSSSLSSRKRWWQLAHSTRGSANDSTCPEATHTSAAWITAESRPTMSSRCWTIDRHHCSFTFRNSSTPRGP